MNWRCRGATHETRERVIELLRDGLEPLDAAALFWWTRNQLYFDQHLAEDDRIRLLRYERVCDSPEEVVRSLSSHIGVSLPVHSTVPRVRPRQSAASVGGSVPRSSTSALRCGNPSKAVRNWLRGRSTRFEDGARRSGSPLDGSGRASAQASGFGSARRRRRLLGQGVHLAAGSTRRDHEPVQATLMGVEGRPTFRRDPHGFWARCRWLMGRGWHIRPAPACRACDADGA